MTKPRTKRPNPIDQHVGSRVRMRRMMLGMSQVKLGEAFGVTFQQVQKYEKGVNRMGSSRLQQAADILGVTVPFFFEGATGGTYKPDGSAPSPAYVNEFVSSEDGRRAQGPADSPPKCPRIRFPSRLSSP
jgi:transcriptional regulator with XRE-family HTH domain